MIQCNLYVQNLHDSKSYQVDLDELLNGNSKRQLLLDAGIDLQIKILKKGGNFFKISDLIIVEDEIEQFFKYLYTLYTYLDRDQITSIDVLVSTEVLRSALENVSPTHKPKCVILDFNLGPVANVDDSDIDIAIDNYKRIKDLFPKVPVIAVTNYAMDRLSTRAVDLIHSFGDSVYLKSSQISGLISAIILDKLKIAELTHSLKDAQEALLDEKVRHDQKYVQNYFGGIPLPLSVIENVKINGKTPKQILNHLELGGGTSIQWKCIFYEISRRLSSRFFLVTGPSGSGKKAFGDIIAYLLGRQDKLVTINCAELAGSDVNFAASRLYGIRNSQYNKSPQPGELDIARDHGVIYFDEFHEMPPEIQAQLLTVFEDGYYNKVGGGRERLIDPKIIIATDQDIQKLVKKDPPVIRVQLYNRINNGAKIRVPGLNEVNNDEFNEIAEKVLAKYNKIYNRNFFLTGEISKRLRKFDYTTDNIRKLNEIIERAVSNCLTNKLTPDWIVDINQRNSENEIEWSDNELKEKFKQLRTIASTIKGLKGKVSQFSVAKALNISQPAISQQFNDGDNPLKIRSIIKRGLLDANEISNLSKLSIFNRINNESDN